MSDAEMDSKAAFPPSKVGYLWEKLFHRRSMLCVFDGEGDDVLLMLWSMWRNHLHHEVLFPVIPSKDNFTLLLEKLTTAALLGIPFRIYAECKTSDASYCPEVDIKSHLDQALAFAIKYENAQMKKNAEYWLKQHELKDPRLIMMTDGELEKVIKTALDAAPTHIRVHAPAGRFFTIVERLLKNASTAEREQFKIVLQFVGGYYNAESYDKIATLPDLLPDGSFTSIHLSRFLMLSKRDAQGKPIPNSIPKALEEIGTLLPTDDEIWHTVAKKNPSMRDALRNLFAATSSALVAPHKVFAAVSAPPELDAQLKKLLDKGDYEGYYKTICPAEKEHPDLKFPEFLAKCFCTQHFDLYCSVVETWALSQNLKIVGQEDGKKPQYKIIKARCSNSAALADLCGIIIWLLIDLQLRNPNITVLDVFAGRFTVRAETDAKGKVSKYSEVVETTGNPTCIEPRLAALPDELIEDLRKELRTVLSGVAEVSRDKGMDWSLHLRSD